MKTIEEAIDIIIHNTQGPQIYKSLRNCIDNVYNGNVNAFINSEFCHVKNGCLHMMWKEGDGVRKISYEL